MPRVLAVLLALILAPSLAAAQVPEAGILILDQERFFANSLYGQRVQTEIDAAGQTLAAENREIEAALEAEELDLTERRAELSRAEFSVLAEAFDNRVELIRAEQDAKARALNAAVDQARQQFFELAVPILLEIASDRGASAILDRRSVLLAADRVDITDVAVAAIDEALGSGPEEPLIDLSTPPVPDLDIIPEPRPDPAPVE